MYLWTERSTWDGWSTRDIVGVRWEGFRGGCVVLRDGSILGVGELCTCVGVLGKEFELSERGLRIL